MSRSVINLALSLKSETYTIVITLIVPRKDSSRNKAQEVNSQLINTCSERYTIFVDHTDTTDIGKHLNDKPNIILKNLEQ